MAFLPITPFSSTRYTPYSPHPTPTPRASPKQGASLQLRHITLQPHNHKHAHNQLPESHRSSLSSVGEGVSTLCRPLEPPLTRPTTSLSSSLPSFALSSPSRVHTIQESIPALGHSAKLVQPPMTPTSNALKYRQGRNSPWLASLNSR